MKETDEISGVHNKESANLVENAEDKNERGGGMDNLSDEIVWMDEDGGNRGAIQRKKIHRLTFGWWVMESHVRLKSEVRETVNDDNNNII